MKFNVPSAASRRAAMLVLKTKKHSPTILFGSGIVLGVATVATACKATLKIESVLDRHEEMAEKIKTVQSPDYSERDRKSDMTKLYIQTVAQFTKLYGPSILLGMASVACLTQSHRILSSRNAALTAAYSAVDKAFKEYRSRVVADQGAEKDREYRYGSETKEVLVEDTNGPKKKKVKVPGDGKYSMYARLFDETNPSWQNNAEYNMAFLRLQQNWANDRLRSRGHLFLNEVYDCLNLEHTPAGSQVGWLYNKGTGDDYVDFGIWDDKNMDSTVNFMSGLEDCLFLDFNVDGVIWDKI